MDHWRLFPAAIAAALCSCGLAGGATVVSLIDTLASIDSNIHSTTVIDQGDSVTATVTAPEVTLVGHDFVISGGSGNITATRDKPPPSGNRSVAGSYACSIIRFTLEAGETLDFVFSMDYVVGAGQGGAAPTMTWTLTNTTTSTVIFTGLDETGDGTVPEAIFLSGSITAGATSEVVELEVCANLNDLAMPPNSSGFAEFSTYSFDGDSDLVPEPGIPGLALLAGLLLSLRGPRRNRPAAPGRP